MEAPESTGPVEQPVQAPPSPSPSPQPVLGDLDATLDHLERLCGRLEHAELRFKQLTDECEGVLHGLVAVDKRHSSAVASLNERLGEWCNLEGKLLEESARRIDRFERGVGHEWMVIRQMHEEPIAELKDQAAQLRLACLEAARLARFRLDSAEKAYSTYAADLERRMTEWSHELMKVARSRGLTEGAERLSSPAAPLSHPSSVEPWPLEGVAQLHQELRARGSAPAPPSPSPGGHRDPARADERSAPGASTAGQPTDAEAPAAASPARRLTHPVVLALGAVLVAALGLYAWRSSSATPRDASAAEARKAAVVTTPAEPAAPPARQPPGPAAGVPADDAAQRGDAERLGAMVEILAAADLRRYTLAGTATGPSQPYGQVLWSRSRGIAASASRLASLPAGKVYQLWIVPDGPAVAAGVLSPDAAGRASLVLPGPLKLPLPVTIRVTIEDRGQVARPLGPVCLARVVPSA